jgi:thioredoxin-related protein
MKRLLSFILIIILCPQIAFASQVENFRLLVNNYHYATTVEWDQKDKTFLIHENEKCPNCGKRFKTKRRKP